MVYLVSWLCGLLFDTLFVGLIVYFWLFITDLVTLIEFGFRLLCFVVFVLVIWVCWLWFVCDVFVVVGCLVGFCCLFCLVSVLDCGAVSVWVAVY